MKIIDLIYEDISTNVPEHYRLNGWFGRKYCALLFPKGFSKYLAKECIRKRLILGK